MASHLPPMQTPSTYRSHLQQQSTQASQKPQAQQQSDWAGSVYIASAAQRLLIHDLNSKQLHSVLQDHNPGSKNTEGNSTPTTGIKSFAWSDDSQCMVFCEEASNKLYFSKTDQTGAFIKSYTICEEGVSVTSVTFNNDSTVVAYGCSDGSVGQLNLKTKKKDILAAAYHDKNQQRNPIVQIAYNTSGSLLAYSCIDGTIVVIPQKEQSVILTMIDSDHIACMMFSMVKQNLLATGHENGKVAIWDAANGIKKSEFINHMSACTGLAFSPVNNLLLCSCGLDGKIQFYDIVSNRNVKTIECGHPLTAMSFCYNGHTIAVGSFQGGIYIYNLKERTKVPTEIKGQEGKKINSLHFSKTPREGISQGTQILLQSSNTQQRAASKSPLPSDRSQTPVGSQMQYSIKTLSEVQNTTSSYKPPQSQTISVKTVTIPPQAQASPNFSHLKSPSSSLSSHSIQKQSSPPGKSQKSFIQQQPPQSAAAPSESSIKSRIASRQLDEQAIKILAHSRIDKDKEKLEKELRQMEEQIRAMAPKSLTKENNNAGEEGSKGKYSFGKGNMIRETVREQYDDSNLELEMQHLDISDMRRQDRKATEQKKETKRMYTLLTDDLLEQLEEEFQVRSDMLTLETTKAINNLHVELIRNFMLQENDLRASLTQMMEQNKARREELKYLRDENKKLRQISY